MNKKNVRSWTWRTDLAVLLLVAALTTNPVHAQDESEWGSGNSKGRIQQLEATVSSLNNRVEVQQQLIESLQTDVEEVTGIFTPPSFVFVDSVTIEEGRSLAVSIALSKPSVYRVTVDYNTVDGSAVAGKHYESVSGTLAFEPGTTLQEIVVTTIDNYESRSQSTAFQIRLSRPLYAELNSSAINAAIVDTEDKPFLVFLINGEAYEPPVDPASSRRTYFSASYMFYDGLPSSGLCRMDYSSYAYTPPESVQLRLGISQDKLDPNHYPAAEPGVDFGIPDLIELPAGVAQGQIEFGQIYDDDLIEGTEYVWFEPSKTDVFGEAVFNRYCLRRVPILDGDQ